MAAMSSLTVLLSVGIPVVILLTKVNTKPHITNHVIFNRPKKQ